MTEGQIFSSGTVTPWLGAEGWAPRAGGTPADEGPFELATKDERRIVKNCRLMFGRTELRCDDTELNWEADGTIYAEVTYRDGKAYLSVRKTSGQTPSSTITETFRTLYTVKDGTITDYRMQMPVIVAAN